MDGIIFDVDGTLWDSTEVVAKAWNKAIFDHSGMEAGLTSRRLKTLFGKTMDEILLAIFPTLSVEDQHRLGEPCFEYENVLLATEPGILYPDVEAVFQTLAKTTDLYIVSNCQCGYIEVFLEVTGLGRYVKGHLCHGQTGLAKNETIRQLMKDHHLTDVVYVGDTLGDYDACQKADVPFIFVTYGFGQAPDATHRISAIAELPEYIKAHF